MTRDHRTEIHVEDRFAGVRTNLPGIGWWATLACVLAFVLVTKTGTVDAPVEAKDRGRDMERPAVDALAGQRLGPTFDARDAEEARLAGEVETLRTQLAVERRRAAVLARSVETLSSRVDELIGAPGVLPAAAAAGADGPGAARETTILPAVPVPIDAIYVVPEGR